jgi:hypothetical protein
MKKKNTRATKGVKGAKTNDVVVGCLQTLVSKEKIKFMDAKGRQGKSIF